MNSRELMLVISGLIVIGLAVDASPVSMPAQRKRMTGWGRRAGFALAIIILGPCLWHLAWLGFLTRGTFHAEYIKPTGGDGLAMDVNPLTDLIQVNATMDRTSLSLADPSDLLRKTTDENLLRVHGTESFRHGLAHQYDPYAIMFPYRVVVAPSSLIYRLPSGEELKVWAIDTVRLSGDGYDNGDAACTLKYQTAFSLDDAVALHDEAGGIWADFRIYAERTGCKETRISVMKAGSRGTPGEAESLVSFTYKRDKDGVWRETPQSGNAS